MNESSNIKNKTISGMVWSFVQKFGTMGISFVTNIVLARLLTPSDYGTIGMLMIFVAVANTFVDGGFGSALIQKKNPTKADYSTIFWWNIFIAVVLYCILYFTAPIISNFYNLSLLTSVLRVQGLVLIFNALSIIQQNQLRKRLEFKRLAAVTIISTILSAGISIALAFCGWGVWVLVAQQLMLSVFNAIILWIIGKWSPTLEFSKESFQQLFGFGGYILISNLLNTLFGNIQGLLIGRFFSPVTLGYYSQARKLEDVSSTSLSTIVDQVTYPVLAEFQDNLERVVVILKKLIRSIAFISIAIMMVLVILAYPIILFLYSDKWLPSVPYLQILCVAGIAISLQRVHYSAVTSIGKSRDWFIWTLLKRSLGLLVIVIGMMVWDIKGLLWGCVVSSWIILIVNAYLTSKHFKYSLRTQFMDILPIITITVIAYFLPLGIINISNLNVILESIIHCALFILLYIGMSHFFKIDAYLQMKDIILTQLKKMKGGKKTVHLTM